MSVRDLLDGLFVFCGALAILGTCIVVVLAVNWAK